MLGITELAVQDIHSLLHNFKNSEELWKNYWSWLSDYMIITVCSRHMLQIFCAQEAHSLYVWSRRAEYCPTMQWVWLYISSAVNQLWDYSISSLTHYLIRQNWIKNALLSSLWELVNEALAGLWWSSQPLHLYIYKTHNIMKWSRM